MNAPGQLGSGTAVLWSKIESEVVREFEAQKTHVEGDLGKNANAPMFRVPGFGDTIAISRTPIAYSNIYIPR